MELFSHLTTDDFETLLLTLIQVFLFQTGRPDHSLSLVIDCWTCSAPEVSFLALAVYVTKRQRKLTSNNVFLRFLAIKTCLQVLVA